MGRVLVAGISIIFVVGVIVGIVVTDLVKASFQAAQEEVTKAWGKSGALGKDTTTSFDKMLLDGCSELLLYATHRLQAETTAVEHSNIDTVSDRADDLKTWSSAIIALKTTRLLNAEVDKDWYPAWFSVADRRLLAFKKTHLTPNVVIAKDGSGQFESIIEAISAYPKNNEGKFIIYVKVGQYHEKVTIPETAIKILIYGDAWS
ncbi:hypothetical protein IFM89_019133 [Coptis chinensis]|uniref:Pectinesterase n=1 Tax=Coptis chinensis TaxID=261450 RepID=A0A835LEV1_9MAGN|nr:hypothetical protein IFM89_019133 [Coptis chinensis]